MKLLLKYHPKGLFLLLLASALLIAPSLQAASAVITEEANPKEVERLSGMERVLIFDSLVVSKAELLTAYPLSVSAGKLEWIGGEANQHRGTQYVSSFGDLRYASAPTSGEGMQITSSVCFGGQWEEAEPAFDADIVAEGVKQQYPFLLSDGVTLYFAQQSADGFGGLDIYMTRQSGQDGRFYRPENVGYPFNSSANDYLMVIDEELGFGCFASDRRQPADTVCVYYFMPNDFREAYESDSITMDIRRSLARIDRIADTWHINRARVEQLRNVLSEARAKQGRQAAYATNSRQEALRSLREMEESLRNLRRQWHEGNHSDGLRELILNMEDNVKQKRQEIRKPRLKD